MLTALHSRVAGCWAATSDNLSKFCLESVVAFQILASRLVGRVFISGVQVLGLFSTLMGACFIIVWRNLEVERIANSC